MTKKLIKTGNSSALVISKEMREHLGIDGDEVEVDYQSNGVIVISRGFGQDYLDIKREVFTEFDEALRNLAK